MNGEKKPSKVRTPHRSFKNAKPFDKEQYPFSAQLDRHENDEHRNEEYYSALRTQTAELILDEFAMPFPTFEEMEASNKVPPSLKLLEEERQRLKSEHERHLAILQKHREIDLQNLVEDQYYSVDDPDKLEHKNTVANSFKLEEAMRMQEHDDLLARVNYVDLNMMLDLQRKRQNLARRISGGLAELKALSTSTNFPTTVEEFRKLKTQPETLMRVARLLTSEDGETRRQQLNEWDVRDTFPLMVEFSKNATFREEVRQVIETQMQDEQMEVDSLL